MESAVHLFAPKLSSLLKAWNIYRVCFNFPRVLHWKFFPKKQEYRITLPQIGIVFNLNLCLHLNNEELFCQINVTPALNRPSMATPPVPLWFCHFWVQGWGSSALTAILPCFTSTGVVEVYRVTKRVELGIKATAVCSEKLQQLLKDIDKVWNNLISFMSLAALTGLPHFYCSVSAITQQAFANKLAHHI